MVGTSPEKILAAGLLALAQALALLPQPGRFQMASGGSAALEIQWSIYRLLIGTDLGTSSFFSAPPVPKGGKPCLGDRLGEQPVGPDRASLPMLGLVKLQIRPPLPFNDKLKGHLHFAFRHL